MRIGIIARGLTKGGVARYIRNILREFDRNNFEHEFFLFTDEPLQEKEYKNIHVIYIKKANKLIWDYIKVLSSLKRQRLDVVLYPKNIIPITHHWFLNSKKVNVIHDLAYFDTNLNEYKFFDTIYMRTFMGLSCRIADRIIAVSQNTKNDIIKILNIPKEKIIVVYEGVEDKFKRQSNQGLIEKTLKKFKIKRPFMFYCGSLSPRKNILRTLQAFNEIKDKLPHNIYLAGGQSWHDKDVLNYIKGNLINRVFQIGYITDDELINLYSSADLFLFPSLYEGFGLPILEAQACGCSVLTSSTTSCGEIAVGSESVFLVDPVDKEAIKNVLSRQNSGDIKHKKTFTEDRRKYIWSDVVKSIIKVVTYV